RRRSSCRFPYTTLFRSQDPRLRWAAAQYFRKYLDPMPEQRNVFTALCLSDAYLWADFKLGAAAPTSGSQEVLEDIVGKKVVFRRSEEHTSELQSRENLV